MHTFLPGPQRLIASCAALFLLGASVALHFGWFEQTSANNDPGPGFSRSIVQVVPLGVAAGQPKAQDQEKAEQEAYEKEWRDAMHRSATTTGHKSGGTPRNSRN